MNKKWNKDLIFECAKECRTRTEFFNKYSAGYRYAKKIDLLDGLYTIKSIKPRGYWKNLENLKKAANECKTTYELQKKYPGAYVAMNKNNLLDTYYPDRIKNFYINLDKEKVITLSQLCNNREDFFRTYRAAYKKAIDLDILDVLFPRIKRKKYYWTNEKVLEEADKYSTKNDFAKNNITAYNYYVKRKLKRKIPFNSLGNREFRCIYVFVFNDNHVYVGLTYNFEKRVIDHLSGKYNSSVFNYIQNNPNVNYISKKITKYISKEEASRLEGLVLNKYLRLGYEKINKNSTGGLGGNSKKWTFEKVRLIFLKYKNCTEIINSPDRGAYYAAVCNKWLKILKFK